MRRLRLVAPALAVLGLAGCARLVSPQMVPGYTGDPRRVFVVDAIDPNHGSSISTGFRGGMRDGLTRCGIAAADFKPDLMELNNRSRGAAEIVAFNPDLLVRVEMTRTSRGGFTIQNTYRVSARERGGRMVWSSSISTADAPFAENREARGAGMAAKIIERMAADRVLPACANPTPAAAGARTGAVPPSATEARA